MALADRRRLPGVRIESRAAELAESLPRMDIAVFCGFGARGPTHEPVAIEDPAQLRRGSLRPGRAARVGCPPRRAAARAARASGAGVLRAGRAALLDHAACHGAGHTTLCAALGAARVERTEGGGVQLA